MQIVKLPDGNTAQLTTAVYHQLKHEFNVFHREYPEIKEWEISIFGTQITKHLFAKAGPSTHIGIQPNATKTITVSTDQLQDILTIKEA